MSFRCRSARVFGAVLAGAVAISVFAIQPSANAATSSIPLGSRTAAEQRRDADPVTRPVQLMQPRTAVPADRYAMAGGCYRIGRADGRSLVKNGATYQLAKVTPAKAAPIHFQATELGRYLLWDANQQFVAHASGTAPADAPSPTAEWTIAGRSNAFTMSEGLLGLTSGWQFHRTTGCPVWPEVQINVAGLPAAGVSPIQEVRGYTDDHIHQMATDFLGGGIHCGRPWHRYGVVYALKDCPDHSTTQGQLAVPEIVLSGTATHDPVGWPTFKDWPAPGSLTHEGVYYKWLERSWRAGQRVFVNLFVENEVLCAIYPNLGDPAATVTKKCNDMDQVRHQAKLIREMQNYIDAQWGGPGKGWFRIVTSPEQARSVINQGKLAVVLGTETSDIFNCSKASAVTGLLQALPVPPVGTCTDADLDKGLDELYKLGVRQMVITHKFDNAFGGAKGDHGFNGIATNVGTFIQNGSFFRMKSCPSGMAPDNAQLGPNDAPAPFNDVLGTLFGGLAGAPLPIALPTYPAGDQCNTMGLTPLGRSMITKMAKRHMIVDVDHFNSKTRSEALDLLDSLKYSGVISSHSWADNNALPRVYKRGGFIGPYAGDSTGFADQWAHLTTIMDGRYFWGVGYGADTNGLGAQGAARPSAAKNPVTYPFSMPGGITVYRQRSGKRLYDINKDGVSHYGLYPDWLQDLTKLKGQAILTDMRRGSEAYLQMWERASGAANDACRQPALRRQARDFAAIKPGTAAKTVLYSYGQPHVRAGQVYRYCVLRGTAPTTATVTFKNGVVATTKLG